jgi:acyl carrier protein
MGLDTIELVMAAEEHFGVSVPEERAEKTVTVEQFAHLLCELRANTAIPLPYDDVLVQLQELVSRKFRIPIAQIVLEARFVEDLGLDQ